MNICVCGWYFDDETYSILYRLNRQRPVFIVANRTFPPLQKWGLTYTVRQNVGLEWGAYNHYLMDVWNGYDDVLFMHDDFKLHPIITENYEVVSGEHVFDKLARTKADQAYIFTDRGDDVDNYGRHGRMIFMSAELLAYFKKKGGFYYDNNNHGYTGGGDRPEDANHYNDGINQFHIDASGSGLDVHQKIYTPSIEMGHRGEFKNVFNPETQSTGGHDRRIPQVL